MVGGPTPSLHKVPCAAAMKLLRVLASAGRNIAARLVSRYKTRDGEHKMGLGWELSMASEL